MLANGLVSFPCPDLFCGCEGICNGRLSLQMNSNNPLAVELESENDAACEKFASNLFVTHFDLKRRLRPRNDKDFFK
jgi:hypothetical protein